MTMDTDQLLDALIDIVRRGAIINSAVKPSPIELCAITLPDVDDEEDSNGPDEL